MDQLSRCIIKASDAEFYQCVSRVKWKCADIQTCTTNILIKVEKLIKYYRQWLKEYELIHLHRDLSLSMIAVYYTLPYTDRQTPQILFCCGDLNTINSDFSHGAQLAATFTSCAPLHGGLM